MRGDTGMLLLLAVVLLSSIHAGGVGATAAGRLVTDAGETRQLLSTNVVPESFTKTGDYDYGAVLSLSLLFYEAQRSGFLPANQRVAWRGNSALNDRTPAGQDLTGGYYDAGDFVKFNLPQAFAMTMLSWGVLEFREGYEKAGELSHALATIKWGTDYLLKCDLGGKAVVAQVGLGQQDHSFWRRPEDIKDSRPVAICDASAPGSDVAAAMSAALAAAALVFKQADAAYAARCLKSARNMYSFANSQRSLYWEKCSKDAQRYYPSHCYMDDLAWAAAWLNWATGEQQYLTEAAQHYADHRTKEKDAFEKYKFGLYWDTVSSGAALLLSRKLQDKAYSDQLTNFLDLWTSYKGNPHVVFSNKGFAWYTKDSGWGSLRHMSNAAFLLLVYAKQLSGISRDRAVCFAHGQMRYALGEDGRSFVVGYGNNPPQRVHHRAASCPNPPAVCDYRYFSLQSPNPRTVFGALVGGPDPSDIFRDDRTDAQANEVAIDYNSGFTGALAALNTASISYDQCVAKGLKRQKLG
ncbi:hypothetical protein OEZ85_009440 [Tetradesmus obliquus]|uniref:cellulase n=1 Tax=Tetradesmus obliquus TaxID=3088 RepID=A0ABY8UBE8_TETOB|nr:hypothetical protein OEZ85_009440 [Tetradesmus obliquus]